MTLLHSTRTRTILYLSFPLDSLETHDEHDIRLRQVLARIRDSGLKLNKSKCAVSSNEITFLGRHP